MLTYFPFYHSGVMEPVYCSLYKDMYSWRLASADYVDPNVIRIVVTADSIRKSCYDTALDKIIRDEIHIDRFFGHVDVHTNAPTANLNRPEFKDFYVEYGKVIDIDKSLPHELTRSCKHMIEVFFRRKKTFQLDKVKVTRTEL